MTVGVVFEPVTEKEFPEGYFYAHMPSLGLTTHGEGVEGARAAAADLARLWLAEKKANGEAVSNGGDVLFSTIEISEDALQSA